MTEERWGGRLVITEERGDWIQTYTGRQFYPLTAMPDEVDKLDIAHALALANRFGGHTRVPYSVAQHCILMSQAVSPENALWALLHDAQEAYLVDVPRPIKPYLGEYREIEARVQGAIFIHFGLEKLFLKGEPDEVRDADMRILINERDALMPRRTHRWAVDSLVPLPLLEIEPWPWHEARSTYLWRLAELLDEEKRGVHGRDYTAAS